jgi:hypothetical protein
MRPEELTASRRVLDDAAASAGAIHENEETPPLTELEQSSPPRSKLKLSLYSALAVAVSLSALGLLNPRAAETEARAAMPARGAMRPAPPASSQVAPPKAAAPAPRSAPPNPKQAADYYATGELAKAESEYRALAAVDEEPVFGFIARVLAQRARRTKGKP